MEFPARKSKSKVCCYVFGCHSKACRDEKIKFFHFPPPKQYFLRLNKFGDKEKIDRLEAWIKVLGITKKVTPSMRICSLHFIKDDFLPSPIGQTRSYLKKTSVPSQNLPPGSTAEFSQHVDSREERFRKRSLKEKLLIPDGTEKLNRVEIKEEEKEDDTKTEEDDIDLNLSESHTTSVLANYFLEIELNIPKP